MREKYESLSVLKLKELAKARGIKRISALKKAELIEVMLEQDEIDKKESKESKEAKGTKKQVQQMEEISPIPHISKPAVADNNYRQNQTEEKRIGEKVVEERMDYRPKRNYTRQNDNNGYYRHNTEENNNGYYRRNNNDDNNNGYYRRNNENNNGYYRRNNNEDNNGYYRRNNNEENNNGYYRRNNNEENNNYYRRNNENNNGYYRRNNEENNGYVRRNNDDNSGYVRRGTEENNNYTHRSVEDNNGYMRRNNEDNNGYVRQHNDNGGYMRRNNDTDQGNTYARQNEMDQGHAYPARRTEGEQNSSYLRRNDGDGDIRPSELSELDSGIQANGILEVMPDGYGFIRCENYLPGDNDVYVAPSQIRRFNLKTGDIITGNTRIKTQQEKFSALLYISTINGYLPSEVANRKNFEDLTPIFPNERIRLESEKGNLAMRIVDLISPIGKGQRGMIVAPPKAGKTTLLKGMAQSIIANSPNMHVIILLIDERPEEVTDIKEAIEGENVEVIYSTFDELPDHHKRVSEMVIERAKRLVEHQQDVTILLDSITRLARAYNLTVPPSGRTLSGGLDPAALHMPKRFFGAARNIREGGSLTVLATALVDTGSKMDDVVYEEFKGTGNMELVLDRKLSEKRVFPAIDITKSGTRREDLLLDKDEQEAVYHMRKAINGMRTEEAVENILNIFTRTRSNKEFVETVKKTKIL